MNEQYWWLKKDCTECASYIPEMNCPFIERLVPDQDKRACSQWQERPEG